MIAPELLSRLCCPESHQRLEMAGEDLVARLNAQISAGSLKNRAGHAVTEKMEAGLLREDRKFLYPVVNRIPVLLIDEAIPLS